MRAHAGFQLMLSILLGSLALSCRPPAPAPPQPGWGWKAGEFSRDLAWQHLEALVRIGPRVTATEGASKARAYILDEFSKLDIEVQTQSATQLLPPDEQQEIELTNLVGVIPGESEDVVILGAPYDSRLFEDFRFVGANDGASGAAVLLEIARVLAERPLPYTTWLAFFDGEAPRQTAGPEGPNVALLGSRAFAVLLRQYQLVPRIRLLVVFNRVCDADLRVARDLNSDRVYREEFFQAAARLGRVEAFPREQTFETPLASHRFFRAVGVRVVALSDTSLGGEEPPGLYADSEEDDLEHCAPESLETVGAVALEALDTIAKRLVKIDRFAESPRGGPVAVPTAPLEPGEGEAASPEEPAGGEAEESGREEPSPEEGGAPSPEVAAEGGAEAPDEASGPEEGVPEGATTP